MHLPLVRPDNLIGRQPRVSLGSDSESPAIGGADNDADTVTQEEWMRGCLAEPSIGRLRFCAFKADCSGEQRGRVGCPLAK